MHELKPGEYTNASHINVTEGYVITATLSSDLNTYALDFLRLFNNAREHEEIIQVTNNSVNNDVEVVVTKDSKDALIKYLEYGLDTCTIKDVTKCLIVDENNCFDYDIDQYDGLYVKPYEGSY